MLSKKRLWILLLVVILLSVGVLATGEGASGQTIPRPTPTPTPCCGAAGRYTLTRLINPQTDGDVQSTYSYTRPSDGGVITWTDHYARFRVPEYALQDPPITQAIFKPSPHALRGQDLQKYRLPPGALMVSGSAGNPQLVLARSGEILVLYRRDMRVAVDGVRVARRDRTFHFMVPESQGRIRLTVAVVK